MLERQATAILAALAVARRGSSQHDFDGSGIVGMDVVIYDRRTPSGGGER